MDSGVIFVFVLTVAAIAVAMLFREIHRELRAQRIQFEAWTRIHNERTYLANSLQEIHHEVVYVRKKITDALGSLFGGMDLRQRLQSLEEMHDKIQERRDRRRDVAEIQHMAFLRAGIAEVLERIDRLQGAVERSLTATLLYGAMGCGSDEVVAPPNQEHLPADP